MTLLTLTATLLLSQAEPPDEPEISPPAAPVAPADPATPNAVRPRAPNLEELQRQLERIRNLPPTESGEAMQELLRKSPEAAGSNALAAQAGKDPKGEPSEAEQVRNAAQLVFNQIISGDARSLVLQSGYPFQLEDRRLEMPDELHKEWLRNLRSKRTDLLTLYDVEVLTPAQMEKKYGRPPTRLNALPWKAPRTLIAIGNLSGHAAVAIFRAHSSGRWQLVGYHD